MILSVFWEPARGRPAPEPKPDDAGLVGRRVVVVDDQVAFQMIVTKLLTDAGLRVVGTAQDGREAVAVVLRERPDLVIMDTMMPLMDGLDAAERILAEFDTCVVLMTASQTKEHQERARKLACGFVSKPIERDTFLARVQSAWDAHLRRRRASGGG